MAESADTSPPNDREWRIHIAICCWATAACFAVGGLGVALRHYANYENSLSAFFMIGGLYAFMGVASLVKRVFISIFASNERQHAGEKLRAIAEREKS